MLRMILVGAGVATLIVAILITVMNPEIVSDPSATNELAMKRQDLKLKETTINIVAVGDSLTKGIGDTEEKGYVKRVAEKLKEKDTVADVIVDNYGVRGDTTSDLLKVLENENVKNDLRYADYVFMTIGGNDLVNIVKQDFLNLSMSLFEKEKAKYRANLVQIMETIRTYNTGAIVYYFGLYNPFAKYFQDIKELNVIVSNWNVQSKQVLEDDDQTVFVPTNDLFSTHRDDLMSGDNFHPNAKGYERMAQQLLEAIDRTTEYID